MKLSSYKLVTARGVNTRLALYVAAAMLTQFIGDAETLRDTDIVGVCIFAAKVILAGVIVWRAFIDQSKAEYENADSLDIPNPPTIPPGNR